MVGKHSRSDIESAAPPFKRVAHIQTAEATDENTSGNIMVRPGVEVSITVNESSPATRASRRSLSKEGLEKRIPVSADSKPLPVPDRYAPAGTSRRTPSKDGVKLPSGPEPTAVEIEFVPTELLVPLDNPEDVVKDLIDRLNSNNWVDASRAVLAARQVFVHHSELIRPQLGDASAALNKLVKNPRSALCKIAILATSEFFTTFGDAVLPWLSRPSTTNCLLINLLLKASSNDKQFVVEAARSTLDVLAKDTEPVSFLKLLAAYYDHKNSKVRAHVARTALVSFSQMSDQEIVEYGLPQVLQVASKYVSDNTPEAREVGRQLVGRVKKVFETTTPGALPEPLPNEEGERAPSMWEVFCADNLAKGAALAVIKVS